MDDGNSTIMNITMKITGALLACLATAGLPGCNKTAASTAAHPPPEVTVMTVTTQDIPDEPEFIGQTEASRIVEIRSQVTGIVKRRCYLEGRQVKKGDRLYQIDPVPFQAAMLSAKGEVAKAEARLVQAKQNLDRVSPLLADQAVSQKDVDDATAERLASEAALDEANANLVKAQFDYDNTLITAPIDGMIDRTSVHEGRLVTAQTDLLTTIYQLNPMYVYGNVPESYLLRRRRQLAANEVQRPDIYKLKGVITFEDGTTYPREGTLDYAGVVLSSQTGALQGRFVFPNPVITGPTDPAGMLIPGQFVRVRLKGYTKVNAILVPQRAVQQGTNGSTVNVVGANDKVEVRDVQATSWQGDQWVIESGLHAGERIVVDGLQRIVPGGLVKPVPVAATVASQSDRAVRSTADPK